MMNCRLLFITLVFFLYVTTISSIRCYTGTDRQCLLSSNMTECSSNDQCQCVKYRFQCTKNDPTCNKQEQIDKVKKWAYKILSSNECQLLQTQSRGYEDVTCCSQDQCNRPESGRCSWSQERRRALRKLTDLLDF